MLQKLSVNAFRNYREPTLFQPGPGINLVYGANGSGKSSLLEAIYLLGSGRSFRTSRMARLVCEGDEELLVYGEVVSSTNRRVSRLGLSRDRNGITGLKKDGAQVKGLSELARVLRVQIFQPGTVELVEGPAAARRRYLDWGLFHVEQSFLEHWRAMTAALRQRNRLLKAPSLDRRELSVWTQQVASTSARIDGLRRSYLASLEPVINATCELFPELPSTRIGLYSGWSGDGESALLETLNLEEEQDRRRGFTGKGAHRAELRLTSDAGPVRDVFSRGQAKVFSYLMLLSQLKHLVEAEGRGCLILVDDLASELDQEHRERMTQAIIELGQQTIFTALHARQLGEQLGQDVPMFHVEHGVLTRVQ